LPAHATYVDLPHVTQYWEAFTAYRHEIVAHMNAFLG
jgi:hypothetical protein